MKTKNTAPEVETVKDEIVVDSADVQREEELALKRGAALEEVAEIISEPELKGKDGKQP